MTDAPPSQAPDRVEDLQASARGWHGVQLAVLGFIGLCGVLENGDTSRPAWLQVAAAVLVLLALVLACVAIYVVGRAAWPFSERRRNLPVADEAGEALGISRRLRAGLVLTSWPSGVLALGATSSWWPRSADSGTLVEAQTLDGRTWCGAMTESRPGFLTLAASDRLVTVSFESLTAIRPVSGCVPGR